LIIKQSLKLLYSLSLSLKDKVVLLVRQGYQIARSIIVLNSVKVMNNPAFRQRFAVSFFPYKDMLKDVATFISSRMVWFKNTNITPCSASQSNSSTFPVGMIFTPLMFARTRLTSFSPYFNKHTAVKARMPMFPSPLLLAFTTHRHYYTIATNYLQAEVLR